MMGQEVHPYTDAAAWVLTCRVPCVIILSHVGSRSWGDWLVPFNNQH